VTGPDGNERQARDDQAEFAPTPLQLACPPNDGQAQVAVAEPIPAGCDDPHGRFLVAIGAISVSPSFAARNLQIRGATFTSESVIRSIVGMNGAPNVFRIDTDRAAQQLSVCRP